MSMDKIKKIKRIWLAVAAVSVFLGAVCLALAVIFAMKLLYAPLIVSLVFVAHAFYASPFYFIRFSNMRITEKIVEASLSLDTLCIQEIADYVKIQPGFCEKLLSKAIEKKYFEPDKAQLAETKL